MLSFFLLLLLFFLSHFPCTVSSCFSSSLTIMMTKINRILGFNAYRSIDYLFASYLSLMEPRPPFSLPSTLLLPGPGIIIASIIMLAPEVLTILQDTLSFKKTTYLLTSRINPWPSHTSDIYLSTPNQVRRQQNVSRDE